MRERVEKPLGDAFRKIFRIGPKQWLAECNRRTALCELVDLALLFGERLTEKKREKNLLDFEDMGASGTADSVKGRVKNG